MFVYTGGTFLNNSTLVVLVLIFTICELLVTKFNMDFPLWISIKENFTLISICTSHLCQYQTETCNNIFASYFDSNSVNFFIRD